jgi:hypothetical protein
MTDEQLAWLRERASVPSEHDADYTVTLSKEFCRKLTARLDAAERVCQWWSEHNQDCRDRQALYGSDDYCDCGYNTALREWRKAKGEAE